MGLKFTKKQWKLIGWWVAVGIIGAVAEHDDY